MSKLRPNDDCEFLAGVLDRAVCEAPFWLTVLHRTVRDYGIAYEPDRLMMVTNYLTEELSSKRSKPVPWEHLFETMSPEEQDLIGADDMAKSDGNSFGPSVSMNPRNALVAACRLVAYAAAGVQPKGRAYELLNDKSLGTNDDD